MNGFSSVEHTRERKVITEKSKLFKGLCLLSQLHHYLPSLLPVIKFSFGEKRLLPGRVPRIYELGGFRRLGGGGGEGEGG